jgi:hypothetical protein
MKKPKKRHTNIIPEGINRRDIPFLKAKPMASKFILIVIIKEFRIYLN